MSAAYHLLVADMVRASDHDLRTILAAADSSRDTFRALWQQNDLRDLILTHDDADMVWDGFVGLLNRHVANGDPIHPLIVSPGELAFLKISCADGLPLLRPYQEQDPQSFPEIAEEMAVMSGLYHIARLRQEMAEHYGNADAIIRHHDNITDQWRDSPKRYWGAPFPANGFGDDGFIGESGRTT
ncbi:hypothetical protein [Magnetospirillum gryphiswaldense]|uniref:Uncharacterized protein n=1 Tax=Magnetospirillum gryphiswaldense TaxID=55518 RepID=A4U238_9PROT|nr:hypothetical protein [Magnetospirillum gryphiswaldense]AVM74879.1 hypothetical protein MSR1_23970 [Magnetospirillum gryphiswaldense MSR-1]AVM78782.1 hypothetical protein MSR1L_23970 [Magnetospirillum gryphiswaldense]CAM76945.1 hypothetical protein MGR_2697 [Magnetospirillum gryphiswaldense MSR-1]